MMTEKIGFLGAGRMARALARGFCQAGLVKPESVWAADPVEAALNDFTQDVPGAAAAKDNLEIVRQCDVVVLSVKPQTIFSVTENVRPAVTPEKLFVSIAAGIRLSALAKALATRRLIRVMPNTPCLIGQSASGFCPLDGASDDDVRTVTRLLESVGYAVRLDESLLDAVTGLSGSGPAFVYLMIEALSDGGVRMGLPREAATTLAAHTLRGAADMVLQTGRHPAELKDEVTSPGGTTVAGLQTLENGGLRAALISAVETATRRSIELGND